MTAPRLLLALALVSSGCATTRYAPRVTARGELTLDYDNGFSMHAAGREVARGPTWAGLPEYVRCVPPAHELATRARTDGRAGFVTSILGAAFGVVSIGGLSGVAMDDSTVRWSLLGGGVGLAVVGLALAGTSIIERNAANGRAVDAMNYYNDAVGSLGATCDDLTYPQPIAPEPPPPPPPPPQEQQPQQQPQSQPQ